MSGRRRKGSSILAAVLSAALMAACGSTVPLSEQRALTYGAGPAQGSSANQAAMGNGATGSGGAVGVPGATSGGSAGGLQGTDAASGSPGGTSAAGGVTSGSSGGGQTTSGPATTTAASGPAASGSQAEDGPGVTATTINVGAAYDPNVGAADSAIGASGASPGNVADETNAMVAYINSHGGVDHRKLKMVYYQYNSETDSSTQVQQGSCSDWTQDNKTFIVESGQPIWDQCAASEGAVGLYQTFLAETGPVMQQYPDDIDQDGFTIDRGDKVTIEGLAKQGYFSSGAKVGIATWDESDYHYGITDGVDPALNALGIHNVPVEYITVPESYGDLGSTSSSVASAVLKFRSEGIDHVILLDGPAGINSAGILVLEWMQQANSQEYYPKYGENSTSGFTGLAGDLPEKEMVGSVGVAWLPAEDLSTSDYDALPQSANQKTCTQVMSAAGESPQSSNQQAVEFGICDQFFFLQEVLSKVTGPLNERSALAAIDNVGSSFDDLTTFGTYLSASQHDGAQLVRNIAFVPSCTCYRYTSQPYNPAS